MCRSSPSEVWRARRASPVRTHQTTRATRLRSGSHKCRPCRSASRTAPAHYCAALDVVGPGLLSKIMRDSGRGLDDLSFYFPPNSSPATPHPENEPSLVRRAISHSTLRTGNHLIAPRRFLRRSPHKQRFARPRKKRQPVSSLLDEFSLVERFNDGSLIVAGWRRAKFARHGNIVDSNAVLRALAERRSERRRPARPVRRERRRQYVRRPCRCHRSTVSGFITRREVCQPANQRYAKIQKRRSTSSGRGHGLRRCRINS